jgi:hypothetical protein
VQMSDECPGCTELQRWRNSFAFLKFLKPVYGFPSHPGHPA